MAHAWLCYTTQANGEVAAPTGQAPLPEQMFVLASVCSSRVVVDARKRTAQERPDAPASDVRFAKRPRASSARGSACGSISSPVLRQPRTMPEFRAQPPPPLWAGDAGRARLAAMCGA